MRLESGRLLSDRRAVRTRQMDWTQLKLLLEGIEVRRLRKSYGRTKTGENETQRSAP